VDFGILKFLGNMQGTIWWVKKSWHHHFLSTELSETPYFDAVENIRWKVSDGCTNVSCERHGLFFYLVSQFFFGKVLEIPGHDLYRCNFPCRNTSIVSKSSPHTVCLIYYDHDMGSGLPSNWYGEKTVALAAAGLFSHLINTSCTQPHRRHFSSDPQSRVSM